MPYFAIGASFNRAFISPIPSHSLTRRHSALPATGVAAAYCHASGLQLAEAFYAEKPLVVPGLLELA
ncbi:MAG: hypothetical protein KIT83_07790 [Bryobacterales bacterium]|nr:hypothetical protein [Bryobacterales bacterium]